MKKIFGLLFILQVTASIAQWNSNPFVNTVVCATSNHQLFLQMVSDGSGGAIIAWVETPDLNSGQIYAQHISHEGHLLWQASGLPVSAPGQIHTSPRIVSDGNGGAIISWVDNQNGTLKHYIQKISSAGELQWPGSGVAVCPSASLYITDYKLISDGNSGAIVIWDDNREINSRIYAQRISADGSILWQADGLPCSPLSISSSAFDAGSDTATGGLFLCWPRVTGIATGNDVFVQKITGNGVAQWGTNGINICTAAKDQLYNKMISDGSGGIIVLWQDFRKDPVLSQIYGRRVGADGTLYWSENGNLICDSIVPASTLFRVVSDGTGGGIVAWLDDFIADQTTTSNLYAQHFNLTGEPLWQGNKIAVWQDVQYLSPFYMAADYKQGSFITWQSASNPHPTTDESANIYNVYGQHISFAGQPQWADTGLVISSAPMNQFYPEIVCDKNGIAITAWTDTRSVTNYDIYAARLTEDVAVPVTWMNFSVVRNNNSHILNWEIAEESNNKGFYIERSADGIHFENIGFVIANNISSQNQFYSFIDDFPLTGNNYYRLKQSDVDGRIKYSKIVQLGMFLKKEILVYPNPVSSILKVKVNSNYTVLHILNSHGALVKIKNINVAGITDIDISDLSSGIYFIKAHSVKDDTKTIEKFIKQ